MLILLDGMIWSELGAALPGSGGSYLYLLESYGRERWGRMMAFLFIWQFLLSGPLEVASGLIAMDSFSQSLSPAFQAARITAAQTPENRPVAGTGVGHDHQPGFAWAAWRSDSSSSCCCIAASPSSAGLTVVLWLGVLAVIAWICVEGLWHFEARRAGRSTSARTKPASLADSLGPGDGPGACTRHLGAITISAMSARRSAIRGRTIPRAILLSAVLVCVLFSRPAPGNAGHSCRGARRLGQPEEKLGDEVQPAGGLHGAHPRAVGRAAGSTVLLHRQLLPEFRVRRAAGPIRASPTVRREGRALLPSGRARPSSAPHPARLPCARRRAWPDAVLELLRSANRDRRPRFITTRILVQFIGQIVGVFLLRRAEPDRPRPFRIWLARCPGAGWQLGRLAVRLRRSPNPSCAVLSVLTLLAGGAAFLLLVAADRRLAVRQARPT